MVEERATSNPFLAQELYASAATARRVARNIRDFFFQLRQPHVPDAMEKKSIPCAK